VLLLWDGLMSHRSRAMIAYLETQRSWLRVERMPAYAPALNPIRGGLEPPQERSAGQPW
jgi:hypothetical protein